jgi:hypothetical protein
MSPTLLVERDEYGSEVARASRGTEHAPQMQRRKVARRTTLRSRRRTAGATANGIHRRRNKRVAW